MPANRVSLIALAVLTTLLWFGSIHDLRAVGGTVVAWGDNSYGQTNVPAGLTDVVSIAANSYYTLAVKNDGTLVAWGQFSGYYISLPVGLNNVAAVAAGINHSLALKNDGTVAAWGDNSNGQLDIPSGFSNVVAIAASQYNSFAVTSDGAVTAWGPDAFGSTRIPAGLSNVVSIAAGTYFGLALKCDGTVASWGGNTPPAGLAGIVAIAACDNNCLALKADGTVISWANDVPANLDNVTGVAVGGGRNLALKGDGTAVSWGSDTNLPTGLGNEVGIAAGFSHGTAIVNQGSPLIFRQPFLTQTVFSGTTVMLNVGAAGQPALSYQWKRNGSIVFGATNATLMLPAVHTNDSATYSVIVSNSSGVRTSRNASLTVVDSLPVVTAQPLSQIGAEAASAGFNVGVIGSQPLSYQWRLNGTNILGATNAMVTVSNLHLADRGNYDVFVSNAFGLTVSSNAYLEVLDFGAALNTNLIWQTSGDVPWFVTTSSSHDGFASAQTGAVAGTNQQSVLQTTLTGPATISFWWYLYDLNRPVSLSFSVNDVVQAQTGGTGGWRFGTFYLGAGTQIIRWSYTNSYSIAEGNRGGLDEMTIIPGGTPPFIGSLTGNQTKPAGTNVTFTVSANGTPPLYYQWLYDDSILAYATNASLSITNIQTNNAGAYRVVVSNDFGFTNSVNVTLVVTSAAPTIISPPVSPASWPGVAASMSVGAVGSFPLSYQWRFNGTNVDNATNQLVTFANVQFSNSGSYSVVITNSFGAKTSSVTTLTVSQVVPWGAGMVNSNTSPNYGQSIIPSGLSNAVAIAAGGYHNLALKPDGRVVAWGWNGLGQTNSQSTLTNAMAISSGLQHSLALRSNGTMTVWGYSSYSLISIPASATNITAISAGWYHNLALKSNGTVVAWGAGTTIGSSPILGQSIVPTGLSNVVAVAGGGFHSLALKRDGTVTAWGWNASGQTNVPQLLSNVVAIAAGGSNSLALKSDGTLVAWGDNTYGQTNIPVGLSNVVAISAGAAHNMALKSDGILIVWGINGNNQTNVPSGLTNIMAISAGGFHSLVLVNLGPVSFFNQPQSQTIFKGGSAAFNVAAFGAPPLVYQWQFNNENILNETNGLFTINNAQLTNSGNYRLVVTNAYGAVTSAVAVLTVNETSPFFTLQPADQVVMQNSNAIFAISVGGVPPLSCQWQLNGTNLFGKTNVTLSITNAQLTNEGYYSVVASNAFGVTNSSKAMLNVIDLAEALDAANLVWTTTTNPPWFPQTNVTHDGFAAVSTGPMTYPQQATLQTTVLGPGTLNFWWMAAGNGGTTYFKFSINGTNQASLSPVGWQQKTFYLTAGTNVLRWVFNKSDTACCATFVGYVDQVNYVSGSTPAIIVTSPSDKTVPAGTNVAFTVAAGGTPPLSYQWQFADANILGATNATLTLNNVQATNAGNYNVVVSNGYGITNFAAFLTVTASSPSILIQPSNQEMVRGGTSFFTVSVRGSDPLSYQWQFNDTDVFNGTNSALALSNVQTNNEGSYRVIVSNAYGTNVSSNATLTLVPTVIVGWGSVFTSSPNPPLGLTNVTAISGGDNFSVALKGDKTVYAWGWNAFGKLSVPGGLTNVSGISAGGDHGSTLLNDGTVVNWGDSFFDSAAIVPAGLSNVVDVAAGSAFNIALKCDGTMVTWGDNFLNPLNLPLGLSNVVDIAAGWYHGLALKVDGEVIAWGYNNVGQTNVPPGLSNVVAIAAGRTFSMALTSEGAVIVWGSNASGLTNVPSGLNNFVAIAGGAQHCVALKRDGTVVAWGSNGSGQTNVPTWLTNVVAISGGNNHSLALLNDGSPYITRQPWTQTIFSGMTAEFDLVVMGMQPLSYQWQFNGGNIDDGTNSFFKLTNTPLSAAGSYRCIVSNAVGKATTLPAGLTVLRSTPQFDGVLSGINSNGGFSLWLGGLSGHGNVVIYTSTNLIDWLPIFTNPPVLGALQIIDSSVTNCPQRYYWMQEQ